MSERFELVKKMTRTGRPLSRICTLETPFTVSEAYELIDLIEEGSNDDAASFRFVNTGTIDPYITLWGLRATTYIRHKFTRPVVRRDRFQGAFPRRYEQALSPKLIFSGMRHFECFLDESGEYIAGKSTVILRNVENGLSLRLLLGILNSRLVKLYMREMFGGLSMDGGITFSTGNMGLIPIPEINGTDRDEIESRVDLILETLHRGQSIDDLRAELDALIFKLFDLDTAEIDLVTM